MMDILAHNNWERPIYFASTTGSEGWFGLEDYFQLEGLAYRLVPIKTPANRASREIGRIDSDILYDNLINRFNDHSRIDIINYPASSTHQPYQYQWGGINDPRVYNNEDNFRLFATIKSLHLVLVNQLMKEGKIDKAEKVLDHIELLFPPEKTPYLVMSQLYYSSLTNEVIQSYMKLNTTTGTEKAMKIASRFIDFTKMNFDWYARCNDKTLQIQSENFRYTVLFLSQVLESLTPEQIEQLKPQLKQLDISSFGTTMVNNISKKVDAVIKKMRSANPDQQRELQGELAKNIQDIILIEGAIKYSDTKLVTVIATELEKHFNALDQLQPGLGASYKAYLYPDSEVKAEEEKTEELANTNE